MKNIMIISAHPDDEVLGAGGTILKHQAQGDNIYWLIVTNISEKQRFKKDRVESRQNEIKKVSKELGIKDYFLLNYPTMSLSSVSIIEMVPKISKIFMDTKPEVVYCVNRFDAHSDHRITFDAVMSCTKSFRYPFIKKVLVYECISETEFAPSLPENHFMPTYFVDITEFFDRKIEVMKIYKSEIENHPFPRSIKNIEALAIFRGASVGVKYAEAFQLLKYIDKK